MVAVLATTSACSLDDVTGAPSDASATVDELVDDCVELVKFGAYVGDPEDAATWRRAGETDEGLAAVCREIGEADPSQLEAMGRELADLRTAAASAPAAGDDAANVTETTSPGCHPSYSDCVPIASDVDCLGAGDGPFYVKLSVLVFGTDVYELDPDRDGLACEPAEL